MVHVRGHFERHGILYRYELSQRLLGRLRPLFTRLLLIDPLECATILSLAHVAAVLGQLAWLSIQKGVPYDHFLLVEVLLEAGRFETEVLEVETQRSEASSLQPLFKLLQLLYKGAPDFQIRPARV